MLIQVAQSPRELLAPLHLPDTIIAAQIDKAVSRERDYLKRFAFTEPLKQAMRERYAACIRQTANEPRERFLARSFEFWSEYEWLNRLHLPDDPVYSKTSAGVTLTTTNSLWQLLAAASGQMRVLESYVGGEATTSTVLRFSVARSAAGSGTTPATYTPEKFNTRSPAAATTCYGSATAQVAWGTTQETLNNPLFFHAFNAFGGTDRWVPQPGEEIYLVNGEYMSGRSLSGTPVVSAHVIFEEL
jgi:hypothetical protein